MSVLAAVVGAITRMRCVLCGVVMTQGERERNPCTDDGRPIHGQCADIASGVRAALLAKGGEK